MWLCQFKLFDSIDFIRIRIRIRVRERKDKQVANKFIHDLDRAILLLIFALLK